MSTLYILKAILKDSAIWQGRESRILQFAWMWLCCLTTDIANSLYWTYTRSKETDYTVLVFVSIILFQGIIHSVTCIFVFVHLTFRQNSIFWFEKSDLISADVHDTLNYLDWIGFKKEFFPSLRYLRRSFTNEFLYSVRSHRSSKTQRSQDFRQESLFNSYVSENASTQFSSVVSELALWASFYLKTRILFFKFSVIIIGFGVKSEVR